MPVEIYCQFLEYISFLLPLIFPPAEQTAKPSLSDRRRDNSEEQRNKYDNSVEERRDGKTWMQPTDFPKIEGAVIKMKIDFNFCEKNNSSE